MSKIIDLKNRFNKRWNIEDKIIPQEEFLKFKKYLVREIESIDMYVDFDDLLDFIKYSKFQESLPLLMDVNNRRTRYIPAILVAETNEIIFYRHLEIICNLTFKDNFRTALLIILQDALKYYDVNLSLTKIKDEVMLLPKGEKEFDEKLVNEVITFLNQSSQEHFIESLRFYQDQKPRNFIKAAESLRRCLEEFLRYKLKNRKGLDANIGELQVILKKDNRDPVIRKNIIYSTFSFLDNYFNENSKHQDGDIDEAECEYLIYQTGVLLRYIDKTVKV